MFFPIDTGPVFRRPAEANRKCGDYERDHELSGHLFRCNSIHDFCIKRQILTSTDKELMLVAHHTKSATGFFFYRARPYTTDIGQIKIYFNPKNRTVSRCRIRQLFANNYCGRLCVRADITLIDTGLRFTSVNFDCIYDFPQTARYLTKVEPEVTVCSLCLPDNLLTDKQLNELFMKTIKKRPRSSQYYIVIRAYRNGKYYVDLLNSNRQSFIDHLKSSYKTKFAALIDVNSFGGSEASSDTVDSQESLHTDVSALLKLSQLHLQSSGSAQFRPRFYRGALQYFKCKTKDIDKSNPNRFVMLKRFFDVKLTIWEHPRDIYLIPRDPDYQKGHQDLLDDIKAYAVKYKLDEEGDDIYNQVFHLGEMVMFRNRHVDRLGSWLRGVVTEVPKLTKQSWINLNESKVLESATMDQKSDVSPLSVSNDVRNFVFRVRSIDYGFENALSVSNIRRATDTSIFSRRGSYSLRCRLFGVNPLLCDRDKHGRMDFSDSCKLMVDAWMREKMVQEFRPSNFYALFHTSLYDLSEEYQTAEQSMDITLFHRFETTNKSLEEMYLPSRKKKEITYECLNTYLIESGYASDDLGDNISSNVELGHLLINLLSNREEI